METLGYGMHLILDGFRADKSALSDAERLRALLAAVAATIEPHMSAEVLLEHLGDPLGGHSGAVLLGESHITLHAFPEQQAVTLGVFSRHGLDVQVLSELFRQHAGIRRFESHLKNHSKTMARDPTRRRRTLLGDRQYAALRLQDQVVL